METIVILKKDIKFYYYTNFLIKNNPAKTIKVVLNDIVSDDIGDIIELQVNSISWDTSRVKYSELEKVEEGLYISEGLMNFIEVFNNEELLLNFHRFILVQDYKKITERMCYF
jgi:hypothetical protein